MSTLAAAARLVSPSASDKREFDHGSLMIRNKTLVIGNAIYPVANISTVMLSDLRKPVPMIVWLALVVGIISLVIFPPLGMLFLVGAAYLYSLHWKSKSVADFSLGIQMNGGNTAVVLSNHEDFLKAIAVELYEVIELEAPSHTIFNIDKSVKIDRITGSTVAVGSVRGDILNNVQGI